jgi:hypothetical protein
MPGKLPNKYVVEFDTFRRLSWPERFKVLLGFNLSVRSKVIVHARNGQAWTSCTVALTPNTEATEQIKDQLITAQHET